MSSARCSRSTSSSTKSSRSKPHFKPSIHPLTPYPRFKTSVLANKSKEQEIIYGVLLDPEQEKYGDIITFYNSVYINYIKKYVSANITPKARQSKVAVQKENNQIYKYPYLKQ